MKFSLLSVSRESRTAVLLAVLLGCGVQPVLARPDPPAADRLMDPTKPENQGAQHLFFHTDADTTPSAGEEAFKDFKSGPATFNEFCGLHPLAGKPLGQDRLTIEVLATEVDVTTDAAGTPNPAEPTLAALSEGNIIRQRVFANSQAQTEDVLPLDRKSDGSKLSTPAWEGERLFTCLEQTDAGYSLALTFAESRVVSWAKDSAGITGQPLIAQRELNSQIPISADGKWLALDGNIREVAADSSGPAHQVKTVLFVRLVKN